MGDEQRNEEPAEVIPVDRLAGPCRTCWYCGSDDLIKDLELGLTAEVGKVGIEFHATGRFLGMSLIGNEQLHVTLCAQCGTVVRLSVKMPDRDWV